MNSHYEDFTAKYNIPVCQIFTGRLASELWPVSVKPLVDNRLSDEHWHEGPQIWYTISGEYNHKINGVWYKQTAGSVAIIHPYSIHQIDSRNSDISKLNVISMSIPQKLFAKENIPFLAHSYTQSSFDLFSIPFYLQLSGKDKKRADMLSEDSLSEFRMHWDMNIKKIIFNVACFLEICSRQNPDAISKKEFISARERIKCIENALFYIYDNHSAPLTLESISREAMMSQRSFTTYFNEIVGQTCHNYVSMTRMSTALNLLKRPNKSLDEISDECGFYDRTHFIRLFKNSFKTTPTAWRDEYFKWKNIHEEYQLLSECREHGWLRPDAVERLNKEAQMQI